MYATVPTTLPSSVTYRVGSSVASSTSVGSIDRVQHHDARVLEGGNRLGLALEALAPQRVGGHVGRQHLDRHLAPQTRVLGQVHLAHTARTERLADGVGAELVSGVHGEGTLQKQRRDSYSGVPDERQAVAHAHGAALYTSPHVDSG